MSKTLFYIFIIVIIVHVFKCQDYDDYPLQEPSMDYHELGPANFAALTAANDAVKKADPKPRAKGSKREEGGDDVNKRGIIGNTVGKVTGVVSLGKCIMGCITKNFKNCAGLIECGWNCFLPQEKLNSSKKKLQESNAKDRDIKVNDPKVRYTTPNTKEDPSGDKVRPSDIVKVFICGTKCLARYLPRSKTTLQSFMTCLVARCFCSDNNQ